MFQELLKKLALAFNSAGISYMVIGGQAVLVYGEPRLTRDIDITLGVSVDGLDRVKAAIGQLGLTILKDDEAFVRRTMVFPLRDDSSGIRIDLVFSFSPYERQAIERAVSVMIAGMAVRFASVEDIVIHKIVAGRPRDIEDVRAIRLKNPKCDGKYLSRWLEEFAKALEKECLQTFQEMVRETA